MYRQTGLNWAVEPVERGIDDMDQSPRSSSRGGNVGKNQKGNKQRRHLDGAATMQSANRPPPILRPSHVEG